MATAIAPDGLLHQAGFITAGEEMGLASGAASERCTLDQLEG